MHIFLEKGILHIASFPMYGMGMILRQLLALGLCKAKSYIHGLYLTL